MRAHAGRQTAVTCIFFAKLLREQFSHFCTARALLRKRISVTQHRYRSEGFARKFSLKSQFYRILVFFVPRHSTFMSARLRSS